VTINDKLAAAAASIGYMPDAQIRESMDDLQAEHRRRSALTGARHRADTDSLDLDWAAYQLASQYHDAGDLDGAARWYRLAAANDFADAAFRLGAVLEILAARLADSTEPGCYSTSQRQELALVCDAARWYAEAYGAGDPEAAERLDGMISRHDTRRPRAPRRPADPPPGRCTQGGLDAVINGGDLITATDHFRQCTACQREFLALGGLLPPPARPATHSQAASARDPYAKDPRGPDLPNAVPSCHRGA
jgi:hypothetical protein